MLRTGWVLVRRMTRVSPSTSIARVDSATWTVTLWWAWVRPRATCCRATVITPGARGSALHGDGLARGPNRRTCRADPAQVPQRLRRDRVRPGPEQLAGVQVEEHQQGALDPDPDLPPAEDLRGQEIGRASCRERV